MNYLILLIILVVVVVSIVFTIRKKNNDVEVWPYIKKKVLSNPEQVLFHKLVRTLPDNIVLAQVQLSRFLDVKKGHNYQAWFNKINRMSVDYLICNKDFEIIAAIELDDKSHERRRRKEVDLKKDRALEAAGLKIIRWNVKSIPDENSITEIFTKADKKVVDR